jgi:hypothetical protein
VFSFVISAMSMPYPRAAYPSPVRAVAILTLLVTIATPALADSLVLPTPEAARVQQADLCKAVGCRPDRLLKSDVPGPVINDEVVNVGIGPAGDVQVVGADQRLTLTGEGDYAVRERGPARSAVSLSTENPPITRLGAVVWQGFSPGRRDLAARLVLDPQIEGPHLPLTVTVTFTSTAGKTVLEPGGHVPGPGTVTVTIANTTSQPQVTSTASDAAAAAIAPLLDKAFQVSRHPSAGRLPSTDAGLPTTVTAIGVARIEASQAVPMRLTGSLTVLGAKATIEGPATTPTATGATFAGTLGGSLPQNESATVTFTAKVDGPGDLVLDLSAVGALNQSELAPPDGFASWARWAAAGPSLPQRKAALDLLVAVAATGARASSYSPYLGADLVGKGSTRFHYAFAPAPKKVAVVGALRPRWGAITVTGLVLMFLLGGAAEAWRRN